MKKQPRLSALLAATALAISPAVARQLTADEALSRALATQRPAARSMVSTLSAEPLADRSDLRLVHTGPIVSAARVPAYYVFSDNNPLSRSAGGDGFMIVPADDRFRPILAIAESGTFAEAMQQENVAWWLAQYEAQIEAALASPADTSEPLSRGNVYDNYASWTPIEPLVSTLWGQSTPFNYQCPEINGQKTLTGCLPTAMAQIIKTIGFYQGKGSRTLTGANYTATFDFAAWTPDFSLMSDGYYNLTDAQRNEVSKLMLACGVAAGATYGLNATSASYAVPGIIDYMGYDKKSQYISRGGYRSEVWEKIVYDELKTGRPVLYTGTSAGGHAFVCDGYSDNGMFHINWGWMGQSDGYYVLSVLNPSDQGAGASDSGYNFGQGITTFIPPTAAASAPVIPAKPASSCPITVAYNGGLPEFVTNVANQTTYTMDDYLIGGMDFREISSNVGDSPLPFTPGFILTNTDNPEDELFLTATPADYGGTAVISPDNFNQKNSGFQVYINKDQLAAPSSWTVYPAFSVTGYSGYWKMTPWGGTPKQDHWLMTVTDDSKPGDKQKNIVLNFTLADRLNPGVIASDYATQGIYAESFNNYVEGLVTNYSGSDYSAKLRFGLQNEKGDVTLVGDTNYLLLRDGETRKLGAYFQTASNPLTPGKYKLRLYVTDVILPFDDNYLEVEVKAGSNGTGKEEGLSIGEIGFWEDNHYVKPYPIILPQGQSFTGTTAITTNNPATITYRMEIYRQGEANNSDALLWTSGTIGTHTFTSAQQWRSGDNFTVTPNLPVGNYTLVFRTTDTGILLSRPCDFSIALEQDGIIYLLNDDGKTLTARALTANVAAQTSFTIPETVEGSDVTIISGELFDGNRVVEQVVLPESITKVQANAFRGAINLSSVTFNSPVPPYAVSSTIFFGAKSDMEVFVPAASYAAYQETFTSSGTLRTIPTGSAILGDLNGDLKVNVSDLTILVSAILRNDKAPRYNINGDAKGAVDISDVTTLVTIILSQPK